MILYIDGGCLGNGQEDLTKRVMRAVVTDIDGVVVFDQIRQGGSNNIAELWALVEAVSWARRQGWRELVVRTDSKNTIAWAFRQPGRKVNDREAVLRLQSALIEAAAGQISVRFEWVPRDENTAGIFIEGSQ